MSDSYSTTMPNHSSDSELIAVSSPTYFLLLDAQRDLGFSSLGDLVKHLLISSDVDSWLERPALLSPQETRLLSYNVLLKYLDRS